MTIKNLFLIFSCLILCLCLYYSYLARDIVRFYYCLNEPEREYLEDMRNINIEETVLNMFFYNLHRNTKLENEKINLDSYSDEFLVDRQLLLWKDLMLIVKFSFIDKVNDTSTCQYQYNTLSTSLSKEYWRTLKLVKLISDQLDIRYLYRDLNTSVIDLENRTNDLLVQKTNHEGSIVN